MTLIHYIDVIQPHLRAEGHYVVFRREPQMPDEHVAFDVRHTNVVACGIVAWNQIASHAAKVSQTLS